MWTRAYDLARRARSAALTCRFPDVLIAACARVYGAQVETADKHYSKLMAV